MSQGGMPPAVLLDTCAVIWLANGDSLTTSALAAIVHAGLNEGVFVSPISAWEVGMLSTARGKRGQALQFLPDAKTWFARVMDGPAINVAEFSPEIAIDASYLQATCMATPRIVSLSPPAATLAFPS